MSKIVLNDVTNLNALSVINDNFDKLEQELQNKVLYRDNPEGEPNGLEGDLDANGNSIFNVQDLTIAGNFSVNGKSIEEVIDAAAADIEANAEAAVNAATSASASASSASTSATSAAASASTATTKASEASTSASNAASSATAAASSASTAATQAGIATTKASEASASASAAATSASSASTSASTATTQAGIATTQATNAASSASSASTSATSAANSATAAAASAASIDPATLVKLTGDQTIAGVKTFASNPVLSGGTANGVAYLNGSKVLTTGSALVFDGTNVGLGVTPSAWVSSWRAIELAGGASMFTPSGGLRFGSNMYRDSGGYKYYGSGVGATTLEMENGAYVFKLAPSGTAGNAISWTQAMTLDASGNLQLGTTSAVDSSKVQISGAKTLSSGIPQQQLNIADTSAIAAGVGGAVVFSALFSGSSFTTMGSVEGVRENGTSGNYAGALVFKTRSNGADNGERARIDSSGNWVFPYGWLKNSPDGAVPCLAIGTGDTALMFINASQKRIIPRTQANSGSDNQIDLGDAGSRFKTLYAGTGSINTSDAREKTSVTPLTAEEINAATQIAESVGTYQWLQAVEEKGASARRHAGLTVQRAIEILQANNLNPFSYGFICYDEWPEETNADGEVTKEAGNRYSFRPDELNLFISRGQQAIIQQLQADVAALKGN